MAARIVRCLSLLLAAGALAGCPDADAGDVVSAPTELGAPVPEQQPPALNPLDLIGSWL